MELVYLIITILGIIITITFGYLQIVVPFIRGEVRFSRWFPFVETAAAAPAAKPRRRRKKKKKPFLLPGLALGIIVVLGVLVRLVVFQARAIESMPIAVISFTNHTGDEQFDYLCAAIPNLLITNLEQSRHLSVLTWERMRDLLHILGKEDIPAIDENLGFEICRMDDISAIVTGSFTKAGDVFVTEVKVLDVATKKILKSSSSQGEGVASILKVQIDELSRDIAGEVSFYERIAKPTEMQIMEVTTNSMEAYNYFLRGREEYEKFYYDDARKFLEKAVELDSTFASAYYYLNGVYFELKDSKKRNEALNKAVALSEQTTDKERLYIEADYASGIEKDRDKKLRILERLATRYPREKRAYVMLGIEYKLKGFIHKTIETLHKALVLDPSYGPALNELAYGYAAAGDYAKAIEYFKRYAAASPGDANPFDSMGDLYFQMGLIDEALEKYIEAVDVEPNFISSSPKIAFIYALKEDYPQTMKWTDQYISLAQSSGIRAVGYLQKAVYDYSVGDYRQALYNINMAENLMQPIEYDYGLALVALVRASAFLDQGKPELSPGFLDIYMAKSGDTPASAFIYSIMMGRVVLKQGDADSARIWLVASGSFLPTVQSDFKDNAQFLYDLFYANLLLVQDSVDRSIAIGEKTWTFEEKQPLGSRAKILPICYDRSVIARAYYRKGEVDKAIAAYLRLMDPGPNRRGRCLIDPRWHYELAKLYQEKGDNTKAIKEYEKFLNIWENADADRPELIDAKRRLAKLKAGG